MTTVSSTAKAKIGDLTLNEVDESGAIWSFSKIDGWHGGPSAHVEQVQRVVTHGQFAQVGRRGGRTIMIEGAVHAEDRGVVASAVQRLATVLANGSFETFEFIDDNLGSRWTPVQLLDAPALEWDANGRFCRFQLSLLAPSAFKFGVVSSASTAFAAEPVGSGLVFDLFPDGVLDFGALADVGQLAVTNHGTAEASVVLTVSGETPEGGFTITDTTSGSRLRFLSQVPVDGELVIRTADGSVILNGTADRLGDTVVDSWFSVPAGTTRAYLFEPNGTPTDATLTASVVSTYW